MLRAVQFASRFNFIIEDETQSMIEKNRNDIKLITGERIHDELDKIFYKGDIEYGLLLLEKCFNNLVNNKKIEHDIAKSIKTVHDFYYILFKDSSSYKLLLKGKNDITKGIDAIKRLNTLVDGEDKKDKIRHYIHIAHKISPSILNSGLTNCNTFFEEFKKNIYPITLSHLKINGDDLIDKGYEGSDIGKKLLDLLILVYSNNIKNEKQDLLNQL